jgi:Uma2 family endonuclease
LGDERKDSKPKTDPLLLESPVTYDIYANLPDDGIRYEVADGKLEAMSPGPYSLHQFVLQSLLYRLLQDCSEDYIIVIAPIDVILSDIEVRQPDLLFIHKNREHIITKRGIEGSPDLVVEISSVHSIRRDKVQKIKSYAKYAIPEYWIIDLSSQTLEQYLLEGTSYQLEELYREDEIIRSERIGCVSFTMNYLISKVPNSLKQQY